MTGSQRYLYVGTHLLCNFGEQRVMEVAANERTVSLNNDVVLLAVFDDGPLLTEWVKLYVEIESPFVPV